MIDQTAQNEGTIVTEATGKCQGAAEKLSPSSQECEQGQPFKELQIVLYCLKKPTASSPCSIRQRGVMEAFGKAQAHVEGTPSSEATSLIVGLNSAGMPRLDLGGKLELAQAVTYESLVRNLQATIDLQYIPPPGTAQRK